MTHAPPLDVERFRRADNAHVIYHRRTNPAHRSSECNDWIAAEYARLAMTEDRVPNPCHRCEGRGWIDNSTDYRDPDGRPDCSCCGGTGVERIKSAEQPAPPLDVERLREALDRFDLIDYRDEPHLELAQDPAEVIAAEYARLGSAPSSLVEERVGKRCE